jgi:RNA polymerase sigma-70 factor, ECF subfamily
VTEEKQIFSDDDIVQSVCTGRTQDFEVLVNRYKKKIINFIYKMIYDYDEAQSLTQDVFIKVYQSLGKYKRQDNFQAFIFTIAKNLTLNYIKKHKRVSWLSSLTGGSGTDHEAHYFRAEGQQEQIIERSEQDRQLTSALRTLNENQRIALIMKVYLEFSYKKIAEVTGWSEPKIETLISRAKSALKKQIGAMEGGNRQQKVQEKQRSNVLEMRSI